MLKLQFDCLSPFSIAYSKDKVALFNNNLIRKQYRNGQQLARPPAASAQPPGLPLRLEEGEDVTLTDRALDVPHDETVLVVQELHPDLGHLTPRASAAHHLHHNSKLNLGIHTAPTELISISQGRRGNI